MIMDALNATGTSDMANNISQVRSPLYTAQMIFAYNAFLSLVITFGVPGNLLVILVFFKMKTFTSTDWFIVFITVADLLSSVFNVPVYLTFTNGAWRYYGTNAMCKTHMYFSQVVVLTSALITCGLAVERYLKVCRPYARPMARNTARNVCIICTSVAALASLPAVSMYRNVNGACKSVKLTTPQFVYFLAVFVLFIAVFAVIVFCYARICFAIKNSQRRLNAHDDLSSFHVTRQNHGKTLYGRNRVSPGMQSTHLNGSITVQKFQADSTVKCTDTSSSVLSNHGHMYEHQNDIKTTELFSVGSNPPPLQEVWTSQKSHTDHTQVDSLDSDPLGTRTGNNGGFSRPSAVTAHKSSRPSLQTTKIAFFVCTIYIVSWVIPWACFILLQTTPTTDVIRFAMFGRMAYLVNTFTNPFLYAWLNPKFRQNLKACFKLCRSSAPHRT